MRLMGIGKLKGLAKCGTVGVAGAVSALFAELVCAQWQSESEFLTQFPLASFENGIVRLPMGDAHRVELIINYDVGMVLVAFAGASADGRRTDKDRSKAA